MIYCVFLDPESIRQAGAKSDDRVDHLIGVLRALLKNCLLAETTDWRVGTEMKEAVKTISDPNLRKKAGTLLEVFHTRNRFASFLVDKPDAPPATVALAHRDHPELDVIVTETPEPHPPGRTEVTTLARFNSSDFADKRNRDSGTLSSGQYEADEFFQTFFSKLLLAKFPKWEICDYALGKTSQFGENYFHNLEWWIKFLAKADRAVEFVIHTQDCRDRPVQHSIQKRLDELCEGTCVQARVETHRRLPHERYLIITGAFTFNIGRGIDLINLRTRKNWDVNISISDPPLQINALIPIRYYTCRRCQGKGREELDCDLCAGTGVFRGKCKKCGGNRKVTHDCENCKGTGKYPPA